MTLFRVLQVSIVVVLLFGSTWVVRALGMVAEPPGRSAAWLGSTTVMAGVLQQNGNENDNTDNNNNNANANSNTNSNTNANSNGNTADNDEDNDEDNDDNSNDNGYDDNDNYDFDLPPFPAEPTRPPQPECARPGQDTTFTSRDGKVTVRVFASTPQQVKVEILQVIDFLSAPLPPGNLVGLLAYEIRASHCDTAPLAAFPAEVNLGIRYNDIEATGLDESRFVIGRLDLPSGVWRPMEKIGNDPAGNYVSATIIETGFYMVWERR